MIAPPLTQPEAPWRTGSGDVSVFFRVADVYKNATITVKDGDEIVYKKRKMHLAPGEMEDVVIQNDMLKGFAAGGVIEISVEV